MATQQPLSISDLLKQQQEETKPIRPVPATAEAMYGDLTKEEEETKSTLADPFGYEMEELGLLDREQEEAKLEDVQQRKQKRYESYVDPKKLQRLELQRQNAAQVGDLELAESLQQQINDFGTLMTDEGQRVKIPTPEQTDFLVTMFEKAGRDTLRGLSTFIPGVDENDIATIKSDDAIVNLGAELIPMSVGAYAGATAAVKLLSKAPIAIQWIGRLVGAPLGESVVATSETETILEDDWAELSESQDVRSKLAILIEGAAINTGLAGVSAAVHMVPSIAVTNFVKALPTILFASKKSIEDAGEGYIAKLVADASNAKTPEEEYQALLKINETMRTKFSEMYPDLDYDAVMKGEQELPADFQATFADIADSEVFSRAQKGMENTGDRGRAFTGRREQQQKSVAALSDRTPEQRAAAEEQATQAREQLGEGVQRDIEAIEEVPEAVRGLQERVVEPAAQRAVEAPNVGRAQAQSAQAAKTEASERASSVFRDVYLDDMATKNAKYEEYLGSLTESVPANDVLADFEGVVRDLGVADPAAVLIPGNKLYQGVLNRLIAQEKRFNSKLMNSLEEMVPDLDEVAAAQGQSRLQAAAEVLGEDVVADLYDDVLEAMKREGTYKDVELKDIEGILQSVNAAKRGGTQDRTLGAAYDKLSTMLDDIVTKNIDETQIALRDDAVEFYQDLSDTYRKDKGRTIAKTLNFGDSISPQELAKVQNQLANNLSKLGTDPESLQFIADVRNRMDPMQLTEFDKALKDFYVNDIFTRVRVATDEGDVVKTGSALASKLRQQADDPRYTNVMAMFPEIKDDLMRMADQVAAGTLAATKGREAVKAAETTAEAAAKQRRATTSAKLAEAPRTTSSVSRIKELLTDKDAEYKIEEIWSNLDDAGKDNFRAGAADAVLELISTGSKQADTIRKSPAFAKIFPEDSAEYSLFNMLAARGEAANMATRGVKFEATQGKPEKIVENVIKYVKGPLSKEGRQASLEFRAANFLLGGRQKVENYVMDAFLDIRIANDIVERATERAQKAMMGMEDALEAEYAGYILRRAGWTSLQEFNKAEEEYLLEQQMQEAIPY